MRATWPGTLPMLLEDGARTYVWSAKGLAYSVDTSGAVQVAHADGLGSVRVLTDATGQVVQTYRTDAFGVATQTQGTSAQPFGFTGEQRDGETGFVYLRARYYDPATGRFLTKDPFPGVATRPATQHPYGYAFNNPVTFTDPSGNFAIIPVVMAVCTANPLFCAAGVAFVATGISAGIQI